MLPRPVQRRLLPQRSSLTTRVDFSFMTTEENEAFIAQTPDADFDGVGFGMHKAMTSRVAAQDLVKFCDQNNDCGIWYSIAETTSQFTFAKLQVDQVQPEVGCLHVRSGVRSPVHSVRHCGAGSCSYTYGPATHAQSQAPVRSPSKQGVSQQSALGKRNVKLRVAPSSHLVLDLLDLSQFMWHARFDKHKKSSFLTYFSHYEYGFHQKTQASSSQEKRNQESSLRLMMTG